MSSISRIILNFRVSTLAECQKVAMDRVIILIQTVRLTLEAVFKVDFQLIVGE